MEKRLILSLALSFAVLYIWAAMGPKPDLQNHDMLSSEMIVEQDVKGSKADSESLQQSPKGYATPAPSSNLGLLAEKEETLASFAQDVVLRNDKIEVVLSNLGGNIKSVLIKDFQTGLPVGNILAIKAFDQEIFEIVAATDRYAEFKLKLDEGFVIRRFQLSEDDYVLNVGVRFSGNIKMSNLNNPHINGFTLNIPEDIATMDMFGDNRNRGLYEYVIQTDGKALRKNNAYKFSDKNNESDTVDVKWVGFRNRYFCALVKADFASSGYKVEKIAENELDIGYVLGESGQDQSVYKALAYFGPENITELKKYDLGFEHIQQYYRLGIFDGIAKLIHGLMHLIHKVVPNWGLSIILISLLIYGCTYPLTIKSMSSMKRMQSLQPKMAKIKEKHAKNPQKMNQEMMELYKKEKVNPLGGCLPMFLQLPVFIGLYQVLWRSVEFKHAGFLWIKDLAEPDRLYVMKNAIPFIGTDINVLPLLMMVIMFIQQKLSAKNMTITDPMQAQQQKMMQTIFPIFLGVIFYKFASGLALYFTMFYMLSAFTQWKLAKQPKAVSS